MGRFIFSLILLVGLAYGGLYFHYGETVKQAVDERLDGLGLTAVDVKGVDFSPLAPLSSHARIAANVTYQGVEASLELRLIGHPLFSEEIRLELDGLQALRLTLGTGG